MRRLVCCHVEHQLRNALMLYACVCCCCVCQLAVSVVSNEAWRDTSVQERSRHRQQLDLPPTALCQPSPADAAPQPSTQPFRHQHISQLQHVRQRRLISCCPPLALVVTPAALNTERRYNHRHTRLTLHEDQLKHIVHISRQQTTNVAATTPSPNRTSQQRHNTQSMIT
jgi:hypothetical protein